MNHQLHSHHNNNNKNIPMELNDKHNWKLKNLLDSRHANNNEMNLYSIGKS